MFNIYEGVLLIFPHEIQGNMGAVFFVSVFYGQKCIDSYAMIEINNYSEDGNPPLSKWFLEISFGASQPIRVLSRC